VPADIRLGVRDGVLPTLVHVLDFFDIQSKHDECAWGMGHRGAESGLGSLLVCKLQLDVRDGDSYTWSAIYKIYF
jgi:hypothetical protein